MQESKLLQAVVWHTEILYVAGVARLAQCVLPKQGLTVPLAFFVGLVENLAILPNIRAIIPRSYPYPGEIT